MKTLVIFMTVSGMLVAPQITKASLNWVDVSVADSSTKTSKINDFANTVSCTIPMKLISKHEILLEDKFSIPKLLLAQEC